MFPGGLLGDQEFGSGTQRTPAPCQALEPHLHVPHSPPLGEAKVGILNYAKIYSESEMPPASEPLPFPPLRRGREKALVRRSRWPRAGPQRSLQLT